MRVLALDYGSARCGCALSDATGTIATPLPALARAATRSGMAALVALAREREVELVLVGLPLTLSGEDSEQTREVRAFARRLATRLPEIPLELHDERFTTVLAQRTAGQASDEDSRAAALLLDSWLAAQAAQRAAGTPGH